MLKNIESEKTLERSLKNFIELKMKGWSLKLLCQHITGLPDRICLIYPGIIFFAEIKTTKKKPKPIQLFVHAKLRALGFAVYVIDCTGDIEKLKEIYAN